jgi:nitroreductase
MSNAVLECLTRHRSIRRYKPDPVPEDTIHALVEAGVRAASAGNLQLYSFLIVDDKEKLALFDDWLQPMIKRPPLIIIALVDLFRTKRWLEVNDAKTPIMDRPIYFMLGLWDTYIALHNVVIAAESMGLGGCYYGSIMEFDVQTHFGTPEYVFPAGMVCLGYPDQEPQLRNRLPVKAVIHRNVYERFDDETIRSLYAVRERVWDHVSDERKEKLKAEGITSIPQAIAVQRFSDEPTRRRSRGILDNFRKAGFRFEI